MKEIKLIEKMGTNSLVREQNNKIIVLAILNTPNKFASQSHYTYSLRWPPLPPPVNPSHGAYKFHEFPITTATSVAMARVPISQSPSTSVVSTIRAYALPLIFFAGAMFYQLVAIPNAFPPSRYDGDSFFLLSFFFYFHFFEKLPILFFSLFCLCGCSSANWEVQFHRRCAGGLR